jgi:hypothetical protein
VAAGLGGDRAEQQRGAMLEERDRIAADLHDHIIRRLFAAGLSLQSVAAALPPGRAAERIVDTIADLDDTISQIRTTIFELRRLPSSGGAGFGSASSTSWATSPPPSDSTPRCGWPVRWSTCCPPPSPRTSSPCCGRRSRTSPGMRERSP